MKYRSSIVLILLAALLAGGLAYAADKPVPLKTYRNEQYGIEFRYPGDMDILTSSNTATFPLEDPWCEFPRSWQESILVQIIYQPFAESQMHLREPRVWAHILIRSKTTTETCLPDNMNAVMEGEINGFTKYQEYVNNDKGAGEIFQNYSTVHNGACVLILTDMARYASWHDAKTKDSKAHFEKFADLVKSFRFLDSETKAK